MLPQPINYKGTLYTTDEVNQMKNWLLDASILTQEEVDNLRPYYFCKWVAAYYEGGVDQFAIDNNFSETL